MTANVFEESTLTLSAWIARGKGDRASAKFEFEQEGGSETVEAAELELGGKDGDKKKVSTQITLPKCKDDEDVYTLSYKVTCGGVEYPGNDFKVWLKTAKFKAVDSEGAALKGVPLTFNQTGDKLYVTDSAGECPLPINATAPAKITVRSPCSVDEWTTEVGRLREATVTKKEYKAVVVDPALEDNAEDTPLRQYTNLKVDATAPRQGSKITVTIGGMTDTECIPGIPGDPIYVKLEWDKDAVSKRNDPKRALIIDGSTVEPNDEGVAEGEMKFDDKGEASFEVELGQAGGDIVKIHTGITSATEDSTLHVQNWRRLWYQLTVPKGTDEPSLDRMTAALDEVFVEYIQEGDTVEVPEDDGPAGSWFDGAWIGEDGKKLLNVGDHNKTHFHGKFDDAKTPHMVHVMCCHTQYDTGGAGTQVDFLDVEVTKDTKDKWSDGSDVIGFKKKVGRGFFPKSLKDGGSSLISGSWESDDGSESGDIEDEHLHIADSHFTLKLPDEAVTYLGDDATKKVKVDISVFKAKGPYLGEADGTKKYLQLIVIRLSENVSNDVAAHELGHTMKQVPQAAGGKPPGMGTVTHGREYTGNGHQGGHCADGMASGDYNGGAGAGTYAGNFKGKKECTCIMYGENGEGSTCTGKFCDRCKPFIKGQALDTLH